MCRSFAVLAGATLLVGLSANHASGALVAPVILCTETFADAGTSGGGCQGTISAGLADTHILTINPASDSEGHFDVVGYGADTTDSIIFSVDGGNTTVNNVSAGGWTSNKVDGVAPIPHGSLPAYALPADLSGIGCGIENNTTCEPLGVFDLNQAITTGLGTYVILDEDGVTVSDTVTLSNDATSGNGVIRFQSSPDTPEPSTAFLSLGALGLLLAAFGRRRFGRTA